MFDRAWQVPQDLFIEAWNASESLDEAATKIKGLAGGQVPRWAVLCRAQAIKDEGIEMKKLERM